MSTREDIRLYCGINEHSWDHQPTAPGPYACIAPVYGKSRKTQETNGVTLPANTSVLQDSGAFSDCNATRLDPGAALERMYRHSDRYHYDSQITHRASYDQLIDEQWDDNDIRHKIRWSELDATDAVRQTIEAARYLSLHIDRSRNGAILSAQGVTAAQYLYCTQQILEYHQPDTDIFGLGGWCITGKNPTHMLPIFKKTMRLVIPQLASARVQWIHLWGVCYFAALAELLALCDIYGIPRISIDSASPQLRPIFGNWGYADWTDLSYTRKPIEQRGQERERHVIATRSWLETFRETTFYRDAYKEVTQFINGEKSARARLQARKDAHRYITPIVT